MNYFYNVQLSERLAYLDIMETPTPLKPFKPHGSKTSRRIRGEVNWGPINPFLPTVAFSLPSSNIYCPRDCVSRHNGGTLGAPLKPLRVDSAFRALSTLRNLRGAPEVPPLCRETQSLGQQMLERWEKMG